MFARYITAFFAITALVFASCISAAPHYVPPTHPGAVCYRDPNKKIGGAGYVKMWQGARGPLSWTSGTKGNNALWMTNQLDFKLQSGDNTKDRNEFMVHIKTPGKQDGVYGFIVYKNQECFGHVPADAVAENSNIMLYVKTTP